MSRVTKSTVRVELRCDTCEFNKVGLTETGERYQEYCSEGHWTGNEPENQPTKDPWKKCKDYKKSGKYIGMWRCTMEKLKLFSVGHNCGLSTTLVVAKDAKPAEDEARKLNGDEGKPGVIYKATEVKIKGYEITVKKL